MRCRPMPGRPSSSCAAPARGCGTPTARSTWTSSPGSRFTTPATAIRGSWPRSRARRSGWRASPTSTTRSRRCGSASGSSSPAWAASAFLCNSGAEANECAIKLVRKHAHQRGIASPEIVVLDHAFHGRTLATLAATPKLARDDLFGPLPAGFVPVPRDEPGALRDAVGEATAAVMIEPIQGEAGIFPIADEVLMAAREACDAAGALLVLDEIQSGMGRTGSLWAYEQLSVRPDVITAAKALGGGLPVGACVATPELGGVLERGDHGSTFAGAPIAAAAALAALEVIDDPALLRRVRELGARLMEALAALDGVAKVRGRGLMVGASLDEGVDAGAVAARALDAGLVINVPAPGMLRFLPPLIIGEAEVDEAAGTMARALG